MITGYDEWKLQAPPEGEADCSHCSYQLTEDEFEAWMNTAGDDCYVLCTDCHKALDCEECGDEVDHETPYGHRVTCNCCEAAGLGWEV